MISFLYLKIIIQRLCADLPYSIRVLFVMFCSDKPLSYYERYPASEHEHDAEHTVIQTNWEISADWNLVMWHIACSTSS